MECEAVHYSQEGKTAFHDAVFNEEYLDRLSLYGAFEGKELLGVIAIRKDHLSLFFVKGGRRGQGIGKMLWNKILAETQAERITVHSSINAVAVYERLGFAATDGVREENGIRYIPMAYKRTRKEDCPCKRTDCARHGYCAEGRASHARKKRVLPCERGDA